MALVVWTTAAVLSLVSMLTGCSRPAPSHPETVAPAPAATLDDVCVGPDCAVPGAMR